MTSFHVLAKSRVELTGYEVGGPRPDEVGGPRPDEVGAPAPTRVATQLSFSQGAFRLGPI